jgi:hypothetical protein
MIYYNSGRVKRLWKIRKTMKRDRPGAAEIPRPLVSGRAGGFLSLMSGSRTPVKASRS